VLLLSRSSTFRALPFSICDSSPGCTTTLLFGAGLLSLL
jgi:hypothetical protein